MTAEISESSNFLDTNQHHECVGCPMWMAAIYGSCVWMCMCVSKRITMTETVERLW